MPTSQFLSLEEIYPGVNSDVELSGWLTRNGFLAQTKEFILTSACREDARVVLLDVVFRRDKFETKGAIKHTNAGPRDSSRGVGQQPNAGESRCCHVHEMFGQAHRPGALQNQGYTYEMFKLCLDDVETSHLLSREAEDLARAQAPESITRAFMCATMTAL